MKTFALALLIPMAICTACGNRTESTSAPVVSADSGTAASDAAPTPAVAAPGGGADAAANTSAANPPPVQVQTTAQVDFTPAAGRQVAGNLALTSEGLAVLIRGEISGLDPGKEHGFHIHETGDCAAPDFASAGEHFNPTKDPHGGPKSSSRHLGDIPNAKADKDGLAKIDVSVKGVTLVDKDGAPNQILGKALVVHAMPDDYKTQPSGGSGDRIACGVIR